MTPIRSTLSRRLAALGAAVALMLVAIPATASAQTVRIRGVETALAPTPAFNQLLSDNGYVLNVVSPAGPRPPLIVFPITSGRVGVSRTRIAGYVNHAGGVAVSRSGVSSSLTNFKVNFTRRPFVGVRSGVNRIKFLNLSNLRVQTVGRRLVVRADAGLAVQGAVALNRAFSTTNFSTNQPVGVIQLEIRR
ncbi:MAG: hypothetical protein H0X55_04120 [Thermoleophilaceae bacterium]|jgi:hypothetical protein|nr:hypothetical protein [Thermoleophilaceae bacterium]